MQYQLLQWQHLSSAAISDALDSLGIEGALPSIKPMVKGVKAFGPAFTVQYEALDKAQQFQNAGQYIDDVPIGSIIVIDNKSRSNCTVWGDILTEVACRQKIAGTVISGASRDVATIRAKNYPLFANTTFMRSGKNRVYKKQVQCSIQIDNVVIKPGDMLFADDDGVIVIPNNLAKEVYKRAFNTQITEEKIVKAVQKGDSLKNAREYYRYDQPWLSKEQHHE